MVRKKIYITAFYFLLIHSFLKAQNYTISGYITDAKTSETLIGASIYDANTQKGVVGNLYGFYSLTLPKGAVQLHYSYLGYAAQTVDFELTKDTVIHVRLEENNRLQEVVVVGERKNSGVQTSQMSAIDIPIQQIKAVPMLLGENDVIKALQLLPSVQSGTEGFTGFYVRGGGPDENLFLLDGVPIYNINHLGGFFSVFNSDAIKNVTLFKGGFPARFGSRLSSVLDIHMNDGNNRKLHGNFSIGLISSKLNLEGPLFSEKTTFNISARRTYFDILTKPFILMAQSQTDTEKLNAGYYFYDLNAKISHRLSDKDRLYFSFYSGDDVLYADIKDEYSSYLDENNFQRTKSTDILKMNWNWGNLLTVARWNRVLNNKLFMNTTATYTRYRFDLGVGAKSTTSEPGVSNQYEANLTYKSGIRDFSAKMDFDYTPNPNHAIKFGADYTNHLFRPGVFVANERGEGSVNLDTIIGDKNIPAHEIAFYVEDNIRINQHIRANLGLRYSGFYVQDEFYQFIQPRLSVRYLLNDNFSLKTAYAYMSQYIHLLSNSSVSLPTDLWVPVTKRIVPMESHQVSAGAFYNLNNWVNLSVEGYYKSMNNLIEYKAGASFLGTSTGWEDKVNAGRGWAYGIEFLAQKTVGKTTGWVGYTWAKTERLFDRPGQEINFGEIFPAKYDRRHDLNIVVSHKFSSKIDVSANWVYSTGNCGTLGLHEYAVPAEPGNLALANSMTYIESRNNYRYPGYHRLDLGINFHKQKKHGIRTWNISIYNAYNHMNPFFVYSTWENDETPMPNGQGYQYKSRKVLKQATMFPIIPSVSYSYSF